MTDRNNLVLENLEVAGRATNIYLKKYPWIGYDDMLQVARIGLLHARDRFDESKGVPFAAFAWKHVVGAIIDHMRVSDTRSRKVRNEDTAHGVRSHRFYTLHNLRKEIDEKSPSPERLLIQRQVWTLVKRLKPQYQSAITMYYRDDLTKLEVSRAIGVHESRICHIHKLSMSKLREMYTAPISVPPTPETCSIMTA